MTRIYIRRADLTTAVIYKLVNTLNGFVYVGSTTKSITRRFYMHRWKASTGDQRHLYQKMREQGLDNFKIVEVEKFPCDNFTELHKREQFWIDKFDSMEHGYNYSRAYTDPERKTEITKERFLRIKASGKFRCELCDKNYKGSYELACHLVGKRHIKRVLSAH